MASNSAEPWDAFEQRVNEIFYIGDALGILQWDQEVMMPDEGIEARAKTNSALSSVFHEKITDEDFDSLIDDIDVSSLSSDKQANYREVKRIVERQSKTPEELVKELAAEKAKAVQTWERAKENSDFELFQPNFERLVELQRDLASEIDSTRDPYAVLVEGYEPYLSIDHIDRTLESLRDSLVPLISDISESNVELRAELTDDEFDISSQIELCEKVLSSLGIDWNRSRLDQSAHGFMTGNQFDTRITANFDENDLYDGILTVIHEWGHALYTLNLPSEQFGTPLGLPRDTVIHESQSRLYENHIGRSKGFIEWLLPIIQDYFPAFQEINSQQAYEYANRINPDNPIRISADELTYHLHIIIRYEIERELIRDEIHVSEIPDIWNEKYESYLGLTPTNDAEGCLQDIHWAKGLMGYFPTYSLGSILSAQLYHFMEEDLGSVDSLVEDGEFAAINDWLNDRIHQHGMRYKTDQLIEKATGEPLTSSYFENYVQAKYSELYGL